MLTFIDGFKYPKSECRRRFSFSVGLRYPFELSLTRYGSKTRLTLASMLCPLLLLSLHLFFSLSQVHSLNLAHSLSLRSLSHHSQLSLPSSITHGKESTLTRRFQHFSNCTSVEEAYLDHLLNGEIREILNAAAYSASNRGLWNRRKFQEFFGPYSRDHAEEVLNWIMQVELERPRRPLSRWELHCHYDTEICSQIVYGFVHRPLDQGMPYEHLPSIFLVSSSFSTLSLS